MYAMMVKCEDGCWFNFINTFCQENKCIPSELFWDVIGLFAIDRSVFATRQYSLIEFSTDGISNATNLLEERPFLIVDKRPYLILPYLMNFAATRHLFDRLMNENKGLREKIGKTAMESYVLQLFEKSGCYDEVQGETEYEVGRQVKKSPDVCLVSGEDIIYVEVKLSEAPHNLIQTSDILVERVYKHAAKCVFQLYSRISEICKKRSIDTNNVYGVVVLHEDSYAVRSEIYQRCYNAHPELTEIEREFIRTRISIIGLYYIESYCYRHCSILPALKERSKEPFGNESIILHLEAIKDVEVLYPFETELEPCARMMVNNFFVPMENKSPIVFAG